MYKNATPILNTKIKWYPLQYIQNFSGHEKIINQGTISHDENTQIVK